MTHTLDALLATLSQAGQPPAPAGRLGNALFVGSGDSLSACLLAERAGHRAASAGDVAWTGTVPRWADTLVGVSHSGNTAATVAAVTVAAGQGLRTIAITGDGGSAITAAAGEALVVPPIPIVETVPAAGFVTLATAVLALLGVDTAGGPARVGDRIAALLPAATATTARLPADPPSAISVLSLPDLRVAGDFWSLKLIEATGLAARSVALEESGHVDYFIGPQPHLTISLIGAVGTERHDRLAAALAANGHAVLSLRVDAVDGTAADGTAADGAAADGAAADGAAVDGAGVDWAGELGVAALGAYVAEGAARAWQRPPFRNREVPMDARHIKIAD
jgi:SIS domain